MTRDFSAQPTLPEAERKSEKIEKKQEMERVQKEAAEERANEGGYQ